MLFAVLCVVVGALIGRLFALKILARNPVFYALVGMLVGGLVALKVTTFLTSLDLIAWLAGLATAGGATVVVTGIIDLVRSLSARRR